MLLFMIIICHHCLLKIGTSRFFCPFMPLQKKNKLLLLLFHRNLDSEMFYPYLSSFLSIQNLFYSVWYGKCLIWGVWIGRICRNTDVNVSGRNMEICLWGVAFSLVLKSSISTAIPIFEDLTVRSAVAAAFFLSLYSTAPRVNTAVWLYGRMLWWSAHTRSPSSYDMNHLELKYSMEFHTQEIFK